MAETYIYPSVTGIQIAFTFYRSGIGPTVELENVTNEGGVFLTREEFPGFMDWLNDRWREYHATSH
jgi:hypothetical protein